MNNRKYPAFSPVDKQTWINQAKKEIKGGDYENLLITKAIEGFRIYPFYTAEDTKETSWVKHYENQVNPPSTLPGEPPRIWTNVVGINEKNVKSANEEIKSVLNNGADGLILFLSEKDDLDQILKDVLPQFIQIWIKPIGNPAACLALFFAWAKQNAIHHSQLNGGLIWDGMALGFEEPINPKDTMDAILKVHELSKPYPHFKSLCLDSSVYHNAGATAVQEIGYSMAGLIELLDGLTEAGVKPEAVFKDLFIYAAVGSNYFMEIAKVKTYRIVLHQLAQLYPLDLAPEEIHLFTVSSRWSKSKKEPSNNLLRNTTEAMAAIIGGCNTLLIEPHDSNFQKPDAFSKRMARNISCILKEESHFDKVIDPASGSYYVENLVHSLQDHAIQLLTSLEKEGGWWQAYRENKIQDAIKAVRKEKFNRMIYGEKQIVGVTPSLDSTEDAPNDKGADKEEPYQLKPYSQSYPLEIKL